MPKYRVNDSGVSQAHRLIDDGKVDTDTDWSDAAPSTDDQNRLIEDEGYDTYGAWHLAIDTEASEDTKDRYGFPYGDLSEVNRAAVIHAKQRASQNDHDQIMKVADEVLQHIDEATA